MGGMLGRCETTDLPTVWCGCHRCKPPAPTTTDPFESVRETGPWINATFDSECSGCDGSIWEGEDIRADGSGGWEGRCCE